MQGWIEKAESDLENATLVLRAGRERPLETVAFHAQQCTEKYLKALLVFQGIDFPKIHDIERLLALAQLGDRVSLSVEEQRLLTDYGTLTRCPADYEPVTFAEARRAVTWARRVRTAVRKEFRGRHGKGKRPAAR